MARRLSPRVIASPDPDLIRPLVVDQEVPSHPIYSHYGTNFILCQWECGAVVTLFLRKDIADKI